MIKVNEIFYSIQGESVFAGLPCVFVRLTGCNLRCRYCDTQYAFEAGHILSLSDIEEQVLHYDCNLIEITGGEPLLQPQIVELSKIFIEQGKTVLVETNGTLNIDLLPKGVVRIMDIKCPGSGESDKVDWHNIERLSSSDNVKFVISHREDFEWAVDIVRKYDLLSRTTVLFSPAYSLLKPKILAEWLLKASLPIRLNLQLHKYIWHPSWRGV